MSVVAAAAAAANGRLGELRATLRRAALWCLLLCAAAFRKIGSVSAKILPAIQETSKLDCLSAEQRVELNYNENTGVNMNENKNEMNSNTSEDSLHLNSGSRESLGNIETSSGMTLPTGVSDFLLECLDSSIEANTESDDGTSSYSSPETFRDDSDLEKICAGPKEYFGCKNSTLLDTSKAINIDKIPPLPSFSKIFENTFEGQDEYLTSDTPFKSKQCCGSTDVSTTVAGKQVYKILASKERTPKSKPEILVLPPKQNKQLDGQQSRSVKFRKKVHFKSFRESLASSSSSVVLSAVDSKTSSPSQGIIAGELASEETGAVTPALSTQNAAADRTFSDTASLHLGETLPASPENRGFQYLHHPPEICCIIKASPKLRPLEAVQHPLSRRILFPPPGVPTGKGKGIPNIPLNVRAFLLAEEMQARARILEKNHRRKLLELERVLD